jgi:hypothetical protein
MIKGADQLKQCLNGLPDQFKHSALQKANIKAAEPLVSGMHRLAPVGLTGNLADSIGIVKLGKGKELGGIEVGPRRGGGFLGFAGHLVEFGTKRRKTKRTGANRGIMPKKRFVLPAWEQTNGQVLGTVEKELSTQVTKYLKRTAPK